VEIDSESQKYIEKIIPIFLEWEKEFRREYPYLSSISRPAFSSEDSLSSTSFETYLKAELSTYSSNTLRLYYNFIQKMIKNNKNLSRQIQSNIVAKYGFNSLQEANDSVKKKNTKT
jgi:mevalonate kinase